jgi:hypothetical protein
MDKLYKFYEAELGGKNFYGILEKKIREKSNHFNQSILFPGVDSSSLITYSESEEVRSGDIRIDMPTLCGNPNSKLKILFLGLEPRHTDNMYNIMKVGNKVFATPFAIDRWYSNSKQSVYASAFKKFLSKDGLFLFSDFVKEYEVFDPKQKGLNDEIARTNFKNKFSDKYQTILEKEIEIFEPTIIIGLGKTDINKKVDKKWLKQFNVNIISHPTNGNFNRMQNELTEILK